MNDGGLAALAIICLGATAALGRYVVTRKRTRLDVECLGLRGHGTPLAVVFTRSGYAPALTVLCIVIFGVSLAARISTTFVIALAATQVLTQFIVERIKAVYRRGRPDDWLFHQELGFSFPSGHATTSVVFFGGLVVFVWMLPISVAAQVMLSAIVAIWIVGIPWSRMVLCAHYGTDVLAGMLFGVASLSAMVAVLGHVPALIVFH